MTNDFFPIVVLISGRGSNLKSILSHQGIYRVAAVLSNKVDAPGLQFAKVEGIPTFTFPRNEYVSLEAQKSALLAQALSLAPKLICLAGFMQILNPEFVSNFSGRVINIHPSLLPALPGLDTHKRALVEHLHVHGCTVHYVDSGVDTGPIIAQAQLEVGATENEDELAERVLALEHRLYPWVITKIAEGAIALDNGAVRYRADALASAQQEGFRIDG